MDGGLHSGPGFESLGAQPQAQPLFWLAGGPVVLPEGHWFSQADFERVGPDLVIQTAEGAVYVVPGYFLEADPPVLETAHGTVINAQLIQALTGPLAPGQVAQVGVDGPGTIGANLGPGEPIGQVSEAEGTVTVTRADGTQETLTAGDDIYQGDVLETGTGATVGVVFVDDTIFTLDEGGRMVMDEMVYDPGTQTGIFNAQVVQGVFSLVSGKVAKTAPDAMTLTTPELTIGIRGTTVAGEVPPGLFPPPPGGGPGGPPPGGPPPGGPPPETKIMMMNDIGGAVGELFVVPTGNPTAPPVVLNAPGAGLVAAGGGITPRTFTPQEIQQTAGKAVTKLVKVVAVKAQQDAARATREAEERESQAQQTEQEAQQAEQQAQQTEQEAQQDQEAADQLEAEAQAEAAQAEAELQAAQEAGNQQAAAEAAAKAAEAAAKAQAAAEIKAAAEAKVAQAAALKAEAAAKAAEAQALQAEAQAAQLQAQAAQQFQQQAAQAFTQQAQAFEQFTGQAVTDQLPPEVLQPPGTVPPGGAPSPDGQAQGADTVQDGPTPEEQAAAEAAAQQAYEEAIAAGASPEEAFNAAALAASGGNLDDPAVDIARAAFEDALAQGLSPEEAMLAAQTAVQDFDMAQFDPNQPPPDGFFDPNLPPPEGFDPNLPPPDGFDPNLPPPDGFTDQTFFDPMMMDTMFYDPMMDPYAMDPMFFDPMMDPYYDPYMDPYMMDGMYYDPYMDPYYTGDMIYDPFAFDEYLAMYDYYDPFFDENLTSTFGEVIAATAVGATLSGTSVNTNFYFNWPVVGSGTGTRTYNIVDSGGINQIAFDGMDTVAVKAVFDTASSGTITVYKATTLANEYATINFSNINQFLLSDINVPGFTYENFTDTAGGDVLVLSTMDANETGYVVAGGTDVDAFTINTSNYPGITDAIFFGKGEGDTFTIDADTQKGSLTLIGGITTTDNKDSDNDGYPDQYMNVFDYSATAAALKIGIQSDGDIGVTDVAQTTGFSHELIDAAQFTSGSGNDQFVIAGGTFNAINGSGGNDVFTIAGGSFKTLNGGTGTDTFIISGNVTIADLQGDGGGAASSDVYKYTTSTPGSVTISDFDVTTVGNKDSFAFARTAFNGDADNNGVLDNGIQELTTSGDKNSTGSSYFVFNTADDILYYDADASGSGAAVQIASINDGATAADLTITMTAT